MIVSRHRKRNVQKATTKTRNKIPDLCSSFALWRDDKGMPDRAIYERVIRSSMLCVSDHISNYSIDSRGFLQQLFICDNK